MTPYATISIHNIRLILLSCINPYCMTDGNVDNNNDRKDESTVYRLNDDRLLQWCRAKLERIGDSVQADASLCPIGMESKHSHDKLQLSAGNMTIICCHAQLICQY
jgi:hypothetical protein